MLVAPLSGGSIPVPDCLLGSQEDQSGQKMAISAFVGVVLEEILIHSTGAPRGGAATHDESIKYHFQPLCSTTLLLNPGVSTGILMVLEPDLACLWKKPALGQSASLGTRYGVY
jgi:hypothetical protein